MPTVVKTLRLVFKDAWDRTRSVNIANPVASPAEAKITETMDHIITHEFFKPNAVAFTEKVKAEIVERSTEEIYSA